MKDVSRETCREEKQVQHLTKGCSELGIPLSAEIKGKICNYLQELIIWNRRINLISRQDTDNIALHHFLDSLSLLPHVEIPMGAKMIDVGTGAGFPGVPLKICRSDLRLTLVESVRKKVLFLKHLVEHLSLSEVSVLHERAEALHGKSKHQNHYDVAVARAVSPLKSLILLCLPFLKPGGIFVAYKGGDVREELREAASEAPYVGGRLEREIEIVLPISKKKRQLIVFKKVLTKGSEHALLS